jgi:site-specific DNA-cytosine methylase
VPQRRRRVFILARRARGRSSSEVLLEPESGGGDFAKGREAREGAAERVGEGFANPLGAKPSGRRNDLDHDTYIAHAVTTHQRKGGDPSTDNYFIAFNLRGRENGAQPEPGEVSLRAASGGSSRSYVAGPPSDPDRMRAPSSVSGRLDPNPRPDGPRYAACGDAVTVSVAYWIGRRLRDWESA